MNTIKGKLIRGQKLGKELGFPTLNIPYDGKISGVFAGEVKFNNKTFEAAVHVGKRPAIGDENSICEAFLLNFEGEVLAGTLIEVTLLKRIRDVMNFPDMKALQQQIASDVAEIQDFFISRS